MCQGRQGELSQLIYYYGKVAGICIEYKVYRIHIYLQVNSIDCKIATDLKCLNLVLGLQSHASKFPCPYGKKEFEVIKLEI